MAWCIVDAPCLCLLVAAAAGGRFWPAITSGNPSHYLWPLFPRGGTGAGSDGMPLSLSAEAIFGVFICNNKTLCGVVHSAYPHNGLRPNRAQAASPMVWGGHRCARLGCHRAVGNGRVANLPAAMVDTKILNNFGSRGVSGTSMIVRRIQ